MNFNKKLAVAVSGAVLLMAGQFALADSATDIVDALVSKGVLTEEEGKLITKGHTSKTSVTPVVKEKDGAFTLESANGNNSVQLTGRMHLDGRYSNVDDFDQRFGETNDKDTASAADQFEMRRARLGVKGKFAKNFNYEVVGNLPGTATLDVAYLDYAKYNEASVRIGKFKQPWGLEQLTSSNNIDFMERSYNDQITPGKKLGAMLFGEPKVGLTYAVSAFQMNDTEQDYRNDKMSFAGRGTLNFAELMGDKESIYHVGLAGFDKEWNVRGTTSSSSTGGSDPSATLLAFSSPGRGLSNTFRAQVGGEKAGTFQSALSDETSQMKSHAYGLEGIFARGPFKIQGEFSQSRHKGRYDMGTAVGAAGTVVGVNSVDLDARTWYAEALWLVTGEKYANSYKKGVFGSIKPTNNFDADGGSGWGALEAGLRVEGYDVKDGNITSGVASTADGFGSRFQGSMNCASGDTIANDGIAQGNSTGSTNARGCKSGAKTYTAGLKWILNPNVLVKLNYSHTRYDDPWIHFDVNPSASSTTGATASTAKLTKEDLIMFRTQYSF
jgi:phosphate-selective porin OprO and OprP